jgi:hypothetical protein
MPRTAKQWSFDAARRESQRRRVAADRQGATLRECGTNSDASASAFRRPARAPRVALCPRAREIVPCQQGRSMVVVIFLTSGAQRVVKTADSRVSTVHFSWSPVRIRSVPESLLFSLFAASTSAALRCLSTEPASTTFSAPVRVRVSARPLETPRRGANSPSVAGACHDPERGLAAPPNA